MSTYESDAYEFSREQELEQEIKEAAISAWAREKFLDGWTEGEINEHLARPGTVFKIVQVWKDDHDQS